MPRKPTPDRLHLLGIRHHGPGSARAVLQALNAADPAIVLIEGPADAESMVPFVASAAMVPPVAILIHAQDDPANSSFYPFATFSPEWQAMRWALAKGRPVRFIDLPAAVRLAERAAQAAPPPEPAGETAEEPEDENRPEPVLEAAPGEVAPAASPSNAQQLRRDPLGYLAAIAGYDDSEAWWNALVEQGAHGPDIFAAVGDAMAALRERADQEAPASPAEALHEARREAHMRLAISAALGETDGPVSVVCGAWHVPAFRRKVAAKDDRELLKGLPRLKVTATWVPWTATRLASGSGYGAGVPSPGWYAHLWQELETGQAGTSKGDALSANGFASRWQARVAGLLRKHGRPASTASVIEAARLSISLAALRDLALPGLDEMREATLATLCEGEATPFALIEHHLVIGPDVGEIDEAVPQMPLAADLARWQKKLKLKPEALDSEASLDLRSEAGLAKSLLLHRLLLINVPWGKPQGTGSSRGTFREVWRLRWEPEFSVRLAEALVHGTTVEQAAGNAAVAAATQTQSLAAIAGVVRDCLNAGLEQAAHATIALLQRAAAGSSDIAAMAGTIPPLASILRYGTARDMPTEALRSLVTSLAEAVCAGLVYACRNLQADEAGALRENLAALDTALTLIEAAALTEAWHRALRQVADDASAHATLAGLATRLLYDQSVIPVEPTALLLSRAVSRALPPARAGDWLDGFLGSNGQILMHDNALRGIIDAWIVGLGEEEFTNLLPMLRRAFANFDRSERRHLLDIVAKFQPEVMLPGAMAGVAPAMPSLPVGSLAARAPGFAEALPLLLAILGAPPAAAKVEGEPV
jgi:Family of unknown function (DUF5682)